MERDERKEERIFANRKNKFFLISCKKRWRGIGVFEYCESTRKTFSKSLPCPRNAESSNNTRWDRIRSCVFPPTVWNSFKMSRDNKEIEIVSCNYKFFSFFFFSLSSSEEEENKRRTQEGEKELHGGVRLKVYFLSNGRTFLFFGERNSRPDPLSTIAASTPWISASPLDERPWSRRQLTYCEPSGIK